MLVSNFRRGVLARPGLDAAQLQGLNPTLVQLTITGFGLDGPRAEDRACDAVIQAVAGISGCQPFARRPVHRSLVCRCVLRTSRSGHVTCKLGIAVLCRTQHAAQAERRSNRSVQPETLFVWRKKSSGSYLRLSAASLSRLHRP